MDAKVALENLILARDALKAVNVRYFLIDGTLLGLVRDGCFIEWDYDVDVGVLGEDFTALSFARYLLIMRKNGFTPVYFGGQWKNYFGIHWSRKNVELDIFFYWRRDDKRVAHVIDGDQVIEFSYPAPLIETLSPLEFYSEPFMAPKFKEAVLTHEYGDWTVCKQDWDFRTSQLNITRRFRRTWWDQLRVKLSYSVLRRIWHAIDALGLPPHNSAVPPAR